MTSLTVARMAVESAGSGEPVIMVHGLGGSSNTFQPLLGGLDGWRVIRPDLPGSGRSATPRTAFGIDDLVAGLIEAAGALGVERAHLVGHSLGTLVCQHIAASRPELVASLSLFGPLLEPPEVAREALLTRARTAREQGMVPVAEALIEASLSGHTRHERPAAVAFVRESLMRQDAEGYARSCEALARAGAAAHRRIACPVLLATGEDDAVTPPSMARAIADECRDARLSLLDRCGHWTPVERPRRCRELLNDFLTGLR